VLPAGLSQGEGPALRVRHLHRLPLYHFPQDGDVHAFSHLFHQGRGAGEEELIVLPAAQGQLPGLGPEGLLEEGVTSVGGRLPVNPSGGALSTNLGAGTGLARLAEAALQVMGRADGRQVEARTALAHGMSALAGSVAPTQGVVILRSSE